ncbi:MAG: DUF4185 domain-containing protein [Myxococcaceae bacterium]|nr:DUF4185 domain-containing protein [Myxococcaceae bacterium]
MTTRRSLWGLLVALCGCSSSSPVSDAGPPPELGVARVDDLGAFSLPSENVLSRDGVSSGGFRGKILWTFGDTFLDHGRMNPLDGSGVISATSGWSGVSMPTALTEPVDAQGVPAQLIPFTDAEVAQNRRDALDGWALWPGPLVDTGSAAGLVFFQRVKRSKGSGFDSLGLGTARLAADGTVAVRNPADLFSREVPDGGAPRSLMGSGGISVVNGEVYLFACDPSGFLNFACRVGRAPVASADQASAYRFYDGREWSADPARAVPVIDRVSVVSLSYNPYLRRYLAIGQRVLTDTAILRVADRPEGPWMEPGVEISPSDGGVLAPGDPQATNYLTLEHVALRSADARQVVVSYARPMGAFRGEVRLARITLR